jgi:signal transduction histidine kinase
MGALPSRARLLTALAVAAVAVVNAAGIWGIAVGRRTAAEEAGRVFRAETATRARGLESLLAATRGDLAFLVGSPAVARLDDRGEGSIEEARRQGAEAALLLFLRGHPEVVRLVVRSKEGRPLIATGRRGGVPVLWVSSSPTGLEGAAVAPDRPRLTTLVAFGVPGDAKVEPSPVPALASEGVTLEAEIAPAALLTQGEPDAESALAPSGAAPPAEASHRCQLRDAEGHVLARPGSRVDAATRSAGAALPPQLEAEAPLRAEGWSAAGPWTLACAQPVEAAVALVEPVAKRYRATLVLNLAAMALALLLGGFAVREMGRRQRLEAAAREEARVRELERQLFHAERLTTVGRLAAGIAHEINNPLEGVANYLTLAKDDLARGDAPAAAKRLDRVQEGVDRAAMVVRQVLAHADPAKAPTSPVDVGRILRETADFIRSRREFQAVRFGVDLAPEPLVVRGSPIMLGQVAANLIINACEAQPGGGEVEVRARREGATVLVEVADRGPGVSEADRQRIFEPFFSTKDSTGLGLSICHSIVRQHAGDLAVFPREGGGAVFRMTLPALAA